MYSNFIKFILTITGLSPILFFYWVVNTIQSYNKLHLYLQIDNITVIYSGIQKLFWTHYLLLIFIIIIFLCNYLLRKAIRTLTIGAIDIKSIKTADINFNPILLSYLTPWLKLYVNDNKDLIVVIGLIILYLIYIYIGKNSYHYNLIFRIFLGYRNYEIQTKKEVTYLMLSNKKIINPNQATRYVQLSDYMIINVS